MWYCLSACVSVGRLLRQKDSGWTDRICLGTRQPGFACLYVCFVSGQGRRLQECLQLTLRCIHTCPLQFGSYCEEPDISREIAAVLKLLLLEDLQDKMVCNSHPVLPLCFPCCWRCFHTALVWLYKDKRQEGISSCNNTQHFAHIHSWDSKKVCWQWREGFFFCLLTLSFFSLASSTLTMCPISSSTRLPFSLQVTGVSCNMLCSPTWVLMRQMNIHEEEADIAVWRLCRGCLCAQALWRPHFWGIRAADRHQGTPLLMMQMCPPWVLFWWPIANDPFPRPLLPPWWLLVELMFSLQLLVGGQPGSARLEKRSYLSVRCLHSSSSYTLRSHASGLRQTDAMGRLSEDHLFPFIIPPLIYCYPPSSFHFLCLLHFLFWNLLCCDVCSRQHYVLKDIWGSMQPILTSQVCVMHACHVSCVAISSCALYTPLVAATFFSLSALFCSSDFSNSPRSNLSRSFSSFYTLLGSLWFAFSHFLVVPVFLYSPYCLEPAAFAAPLSPSYLPLLHFFPSQPPSFLPCSSAVYLWRSSYGSIFDMRWCVFISVA